MLILEGLSLHLNLLPYLLRVCILIKQTWNRREKSWIFFKSRQTGKKTYFPNWKIKSMSFIPAASDYFIFCSSTVFDMLLISHLVQWHQQVIQNLFTLSHFIHLYDITVNHKSKDFWGVIKAQAMNLSRTLDSDFLFLSFNYLFLLYLRFSSLCRSIASQTLKIPCWSKLLFFSLLLLFLPFSTPQSLDLLPQTFLCF